LHQRQIAMHFPPPFGVIHDYQLRRLTGEKKGDFESLSRSKSHIKVVGFSELCGF
jgi:hypothetical protein